MEIFDAKGHDQEAEAVVHFSIATEELIRVGVAMAERLQPEAFAQAMAAIRAGASPRLVVRLDQPGGVGPSRIAMLCVDPQSSATWEIFAFDVRLNSAALN